MKSKKKLLYIVEAMGGGVYTYIQELANELVNSYDIYIAYAVRLQTPADYRKQFDGRIRLIEVKSFTRSIDFVKDFNAFWEIKRIVRNIQPDIIHLHSSKAGVLGRWAFNGKTIPLFYTPHGYSFLMKNYGWLKRSVFKGIEVLSSKRRCMTISCSKGEHQETMKFARWATYVNNGINIQELHSLIHSIEASQNSQFTVCTMGRICYQKNPELFNEIARSLPEIRFLWIGDGELRDKLTSPNIHITGWLDRKEALKCSLASDLFVLTSLWEGLPMSLLEAMYMRKLCVVSNVIGNNDVIHNGVNGFVCNTADEYKKAISLSVKNKQVQLIEAAYEDVLNNYNTVVMANSYDGIYRNTFVQPPKMETNVDRHTVNG